MKKIFDYIVFRVFEYFQQKKDSIAILKSINFLVLFQASLLMLIFLIINSFFHFDPQRLFGIDDNIKYYIGVPLAVFLIILNNILYRKKLKGVKLKELYDKYHKEKYKIPIWVIFSSPVFFGVFCPIIYGALNGTLHSPILEK